MLIVVVTIGYNLPGFTQRVVDSAMRGCTHDVKFIVFSHSQMPDKLCELESLAKRDEVIYKDYGVNRGLAKSWNEGILLGYYQLNADVVVVVNEDSLFGTGDLARLSEWAVNHRSSYVVTGRAYEHKESKWMSSEFGCFAINPLALNTLGCFDENFFPLYYEDSDYRYRAKLLGLNPGYCATTSIEHGGSMSLGEERVAQQNTLTYDANRNYYISKWGADGGDEVFRFPFDDQRFSCYIDPRIRHSPYLGFNRQDQEIVEF